MRIGDLARQTSVSVRSLRYYEEQGLLLPDRTAGGHREYGEDAVERVHLIRLLLDAGLPGHRIVELLPCVHSGATTPAMLAMLTDERRRIDDRITSLRATRERMDEVIVEATSRLQLAGREVSRAGCSAWAGPRERRAR